MIRVLLSLLILIGLSWPAAAAEVIHGFDVTAKIHPDGAVDITETIKVTAENREIRRGIYRDIPLKYKTESGLNVSVGFHITDVQRDGDGEPYHTESQSNGIRIYIGDKDKYVDPGVHTYRLSYTVHRVIGFFDSYDEFYWNVTGNGWVFPIQMASIKIELPEGIRITQSASYTGPQGSTRNQAVGSWQGSAYKGYTTSPLGPHEGYTVAVAFPKGVVTPPDQWTSFKWFMQDNVFVCISILGMLASLFYYFFIWFKHGRDLPEGTIIPRFDIPDGVTPDLLRYVAEAGYDTKVFTCLLINDAVKGRLKIEDDEDTLTLTKKTPSDTGGGSSSYLFGSGQTMLQLAKPGFFKNFLESSESRQDRRSIATQLMRAQALHKGTLEDSHRSTYFVTNTQVAAVGSFVLVAISAVVILLVEEASYLPLIIWIMAIAQFVLFKIFTKPLIRYTRKGRDLIDYAKGLKLYLSVAEEARLNALYPKEITPDIYEKMLPYALALDVDQKWTEHFSSLVAAGLVVYSASRTSWYHGVGNFSSSVDTISSVISSASTPPGSSSGSGGGGSSGGGGGGGGGGGW